MRIIILPDLNLTCSHSYTRQVERTHWRGACLPQSKEWLRVGKQKGRFRGRCIVLEIYTQNGSRSRSRPNPNGRRARGTPHGFEFFFSSSPDPELICTTVVQQCTVLCVRDAQWHHHPTALAYKQRNKGCKEENKTTSFSMNGNYGLCKQLIM
jgi:hypothetical protein